jgi:hypothetical protein
MLKKERGKEKVSAGFGTDRVETVEFCFQNITTLIMMEEDKAANCTVCSPDFSRNTCMYC